METELCLNPSFSPEKSSVKTASAVQPYVYACVFSSVCIIIGLIWDISWHMSIGRDGLFAPPHLMIYLGAVLSGVFSGYQVLKTSFFSSAEEKAKSVRFWGVFYGSLGALFCIWGAIAMLTSAPFDDWWHNTYGLDVTILSPPHTLLLIGMMIIQFGAMIAVLAASHHQEQNNKLVYNWLFAIAAGLLLTTFYTLFSEFLGKHHMHKVFFYQIACLLFPLYLITVARASGMKWAATATAAVYSAMLLLMLWVLPLFPASPRLGPVLNHIDHYQAFDFPLMIIFPAMAIDWLFYKLQPKKAWIKTVLAALAFLAVFFVVQWNFGTFLQTSVTARNAFFGGSSWYFGEDPNYEYRYAFRPGNVDSGFTLIKGLLIAGVVAIISGSVGYRWGSWMKKVQR